MLITIETETEAAAVRGRLPALAHALGPTADITVLLPSGEVLRHHPGGLTAAARAASINERLQALLIAQGTGGAEGS